MILDLNMLLIHYDSIVSGLIYKLYTHVVVRNQWPRSDKNGITGGNGFDVRITCVHGVLMLCSGALLKGAP